MRPSELTIRPTSPDDLDAIGEIYAHHVKTGVATFELASARSIGMAQVGCKRSPTSGLPFLTAWLDGAGGRIRLLQPLEDPPAYRHTVEDSIYVAPHAVGRGVGGQLLDTLLAECGRAGIREVIAVIVDADAVASVALHRNRGFVEAGRLKSVGFKHGR